MPLRDLLEETKIIDILPGRRALITLRADQTVQQCLEELTNNGITSAPVMSVGSDSECLGFLDMIDLVSHAVQLPTLDGDISHIKVQEAIAQFEKFSNAPASELVGKRNKYYSVKITGSLWEAVQLITQNRAHRIGVIDRSGKLVSVLTQSDVLSFLHSRNAKRPDQPVENLPDDLLNRVLGELSADDLPSLQTGVECVKHTDVLLRAYKAMSNKQFHAVGVVNDDGVLVGNLSAWDLKFLNHHTLLPLADSVEKYLTFVRARSCQQAGAEVFSCSLSDTVGKAIHRLVEKRVHRLYVVDEERKPKAVVATEDILQMIGKFCT